MLCTGIEGFLQPFLARYPRQQDRVWGRAGTLTTAEREQHDRSQKGLDCRHSAPSLSSSGRAGHLPPVACRGAVKLMNTFYTINSGIKCALDSTTPLGG